MRRRLKQPPHQYVERETGLVRTERLYGHRWIRMLYHPLRERAPALFRALTARRVTGWLGRANFDLRPAAHAGFGGFDLAECYDNPRAFRTAREVFERRIRYWSCRPMPRDPYAVVSPADARVVAGSLQETSALFIKGKFFDFEELLGVARRKWLAAFRQGDFAVFRLTPDKYHYSHAPVAGRVVDHYQLDGGFHSCNPDAVIAMATPFSKNRRVVTILDTDVPGGTRVGCVAMIEVVALMIGDVVQCYSDERYDDPQPLTVGRFLRRGCPKSRYRPGSSTDVLLFEPGRVRFACDLLANRRRLDVASRFTLGFRTPLVETDVKVRSLVAHRLPHDGARTDRRRRKRHG